MFGDARRCGSPIQAPAPGYERTLVGLLICIAAVALRLWLSWRSPASYDMKWYWAGISADLERGARLYEDTPYHFSPVWSWLLLLFRKASRWGLPFDATLRTFLTVVDIVSAWLLFRLARRERPEGWPWKAAVLFLTNPVSIWVSSIQGQFDNLSLLFLLAALLVSGERDGREPQTSRRSGSFLFLSIAAKQVTVFHPILWLRSRRRVWTVVVAYVGTTLLFLPYARQWRWILDRLANYSSVPRSYGFSEFVLLDSRWAPVISVIDLVAALATAWTLRKEKLSRASLLLFLVILLFAPGLGSQYLIWPLTVGALFGGARYLLFTAASMTWILGSHYEIPGSGRWMGHLVWLSCGLWAIGELRALENPGRFARVFRGQTRPGGRSDSPA